MAKRWVIPDIHGYVKTVTTLITDLIRPAQSDEIYFLGDYIDRGPDSRGVLDFIRSLQEQGYHVTALKGNHEDIIVEAWDAARRSASSWWYAFGNRKYKAWMDIGGKATLASFGTSHVGEIPPDYIEWMRALPHYMELEQFVLVHAGLNFRKEDPFEDKRSMLWLRDYEIIPEKIGGRRIIHGHVPVNMELIHMTVRNRGCKFIDLDNGPYLAGKDGYGNLVALELTGMEMAIQYNMDV